MIVCPVCENPQAQGTVCDVCGKVLVAAARVEVPVMRLADLEGTRVEGGNSPVAVAPLAELEATRAAAVTVGVVAALPELERTVIDKVGAVPLQVLADLDASRYVDTDAKTAAPTGATTCRYCKNVQATGVLCDRCGMRLPKIGLAARAAEIAEGAGICRDCGTQGTAGKLCPGCGARIPGGD
jgi:hypothetical protein